jgi:signal transduction histidine kinase
MLSRLSRKECLHNYEARLRAKDGSIRHVLVNSNVLWRDGRFIHTQCFTRDITDRKKAEGDREALLAREQAARQMAEAASRMKDDFLAVLSHELRTPLNAILGWAHIVNAGDCHPGLVRRALGVIERNASAQVHIVDDLLDISRILNGKMLIRTEPVHIITVLNAALEAVRPSGRRGRSLLIWRRTALFRSSPGIRTVCNRCCGTCCLMR